MFNPYFWSHRPINRLWDEWSRLHDEISRRIAPASRSGQEFPAVNIHLTPEGAQLTAELPGVKNGDLHLSVSGRTVTLKGERKAVVPENARWHRRESPEGKFVRVMELPFALEASGVEAKLANGILQATLPRAEADKPRQITIAHG